MPNCFQLISKETHEAVVLQKLDDDLRVHFGFGPDPKNWLNGWYNIIGFKLAGGKSFAQIREDLEELATEPNSLYVEEDKLQLAILEYIEERYESSAWYE